MLKRTGTVALLATLAWSGCTPTETPDAGPAKDAGPAATDAGVARDAGLAMDAGGAMLDAGALDAGDPDAGVSEDAGTTFDAGAPDAGTPMDAGTFDAGAPMDAGTPMDAGMFDAGAPDAGPMAPEGSYLNPFALEVPTATPVPVLIQNTQDEACFAFTLDDFQRVTLSTSNGAGGCARSDTQPTGGDLQARLYPGGLPAQPARADALVWAEDDIAYCPVIDAVNLAPGDYVVCINEYADDAPNTGNSLTVTLAPGIAFPDTNQTCEAARVLGTVAVDTPLADQGVTLGASNDSAPGCGTFSTSQRTAGDTYFAFDVAEPGLATVAIDADFGATISVFDGACDALGDALECDGGSGVGRRAVSFEAVPGTTYIAVVDGYAAGAGSFDVSVALAPAQNGNDVCTSAAPIQLAAAGGTVTVQGSTTDFADDASATDYGFSTSGCQTSAASSAHRDVFYTITAPADGWVTIESSATFDHTVYAFRGACDAPGTRVACEDSGDFEFGVAAGDTVMIVVDAWGTAHGEFTLNTAFEPAPAPGWVCEPSLYDANDRCDCGCGALDPDCADETPASCARSHCADNLGPSPADNAVCVAPAPGWTCDFDAYDEGGDGAASGRCDCGCGYADPDCADAMYATCDRDHCADVTTRPIDGSTDLCGAPAPGWTCDADWYDEQDPGPTNYQCDCGCGAPDPDCLNALSAVCDDDRCEDPEDVPAEADNATCVPVATGWTCEARLYGEGGTGNCDCGCGVIDPDCYGDASPGVCDDAHCAASNEGPAALDNAQCAPPAPGWTCAAATYSDADCNCGCGAPDPACTGDAVGTCDISACPAGQLPVHGELESCVLATPTANDMCDMPVALGVDQMSGATGELPANGDTVSASGHLLGATHSAPMTNAAGSTSGCQRYGDDAQADTWFVFTAPSDGTVDLQVKAIGFNPSLGAFESTTDCSMLTPLSCAGTSYQNEDTLTLSVVSGTAYLVAVAGYDDDDEGAFRLAATFTPAPPTFQGSDTCADAPLLNDNGQSGRVSGTLAGMTNDYSGSTFGGFGGSGVDVVYRVTLAPGEVFNALYQEASPDATFDELAWLVTDCNASGYLRRDDSSSLNERTQYTNDTGMAQTLYYILDQYSSSARQVPYVVDYTITAP